MLRKQAFDMTVQYLPGSQNAADYLSRHPIQQDKPNDSKPTKVAERYINLIVKSVGVSLIPPEEIRMMTLNDNDLQEVIQAVNNKWHR